LRPGHREGARRLHDAAGLVEDVLDRRADLVVVTRTTPSTHSLRDGERVLAHLAHRDAVGEDAHLSSRTRRPASSERYIASASNGSTPITFTAGIRP
jgi:hypothetical protein